MLTLKNSRSVYLLLLFSLFFSVTSAQHPFFGKKRDNVNTRLPFNGRVTSPDSSGFGGEPGLVWERDFSKLYPGATASYIRRIKKLADGNYIAVGAIEYAASYSNQTVYLKFREDGQLIWAKNRGPISKMADVQPQSDSGFVTVFHTFGELDEVLKFNSSGDLVWQYKVSTAVSIKDIVQIMDGTIMVIATYKTSLWDEQLVVIKLSKSGAFLFRKDYPFPGIASSSLSFNSVLSNNKIFSTGTISGNAFDVVVLSIDLEGNFLWQKQYGGFGLDYSEKIVEAVDSGFVILGKTSSANGSLSGIPPASSFDRAWVFQINDTGKIINNKAYILPLHWSSFQDGISFKDSTYLLVGYYSPAFSSTSTTSKTFVMQLNKDLSLSQQTLFENRLIFGLVGSSENYIITGGANAITNLAAASLEVLKIGPVCDISGSVYYDLNKNNLKDANEPYANKFLVTSTKPGYSRSSVANNGWFRNDVDTGTYKTTVQLTNDYYVTVPMEKQTTFTSLFQKDTVHFALQPVAGKRDLSINLIPLTPARPGFNARYKLTFRNNGTDTIASGGVLLIKDSKTTLVSALPAAGLVTGDSILWAYAGLKPFDSYSIDIELKLAAPPTLNNGDTLRYKAFITSVSGGVARVDLTPMDDTSVVAQLVTGAYDPNDKQENVAGKIPLAKITSGEDIQYVIRFQNTGTDTAFTVRITDTLDTKLNWNSLQMTAASHAYKMKVDDGNKIIWIFDNILLPDSNINEPLSHGYLAFRIKAKTNLSAGDYFQNKASIYFDYNLPIVTNTAITVVSNAIVTSVRNVSNDEMKIVALPNPSNGNLYMKISGKLIGKFEYSIIDLYGRVLQTQIIERSVGQDTQLVPLQLNTIGAGVYYIVLRQKEKLWQQKIIIQ